MLGTYVAIFLSLLMSCGDFVMLTSLVNLQLILYQGDNWPSGYCADKYAHQL